MSQSEVLTVAQLRDHLAALVLAEPAAAEFPVSFDLDHTPICGGIVKFGPSLDQCLVNLAPIRCNHVPGGF